MQKHADIGSLKAKIMEVTRRSSIGSHVRDIDLVPAQDGDGEDFIRVQIMLDTFSSIEDAQLEELMLSIEIAVSELDERVASVRFAELA